MNLATLLRYAQVTNARIDYAGESETLRYFAGEVEPSLSRFEDGFATVEDTSSRQNHHVRFVVTATGRCLFQYRENWGDGSKQSSYNRELRFREHVASALGLELDQL